MLELGLALRELGHEVVVACHEFEPGAEFAEASGQLDVRAVRTGPVDTPSGQRETSERLLRGMRRVAALVPDDVDAINAHEWPAVHAGALASRRLGAPFVWTRNDETMWERGLIPDETIVVPARARTRVAHLGLSLTDFLDARRAAAVIVLDSRNAGMVRRAYRRPAEIVRSGPAPAFFDPPDRDEARRRFGLDPSDFFVVGAAILFPHRRFEDLIEAAALLPRELPVKVRVIGSDHADPDYAKSLRRLVVRRGVEDRVEVPGAAVTDEELRQAYAAADAFVFPNERQTWGLAPLEALASGTPVVVSRGAGVHEVLEGREGVSLVPPGSPESIAGALRDLHRLARRELDGTREWIRRELSRERYARRMAEIFERASRSS